MRPIVNSDVFTIISENEGHAQFICCKMTTMSCASVEHVSMMSIVQKVRLISQGGHHVSEFAMS